METHRVTDKPRLFWLATVRRQSALVHAASVAVWHDRAITYRDRHRTEVVNLRGNPHVVPDDQLQPEEGLNSVVVRGDMMRISPTRTLERVASGVGDQNWDGSWRRTHGGCFLPLR